MTRFAIVIPYFGKFKPSISLFLESCNRNPDVDWHIFTDCAVPEGISLNTNIKWHTATLETVSSLIKKKLGFQIELTRAYKLCDLKPFYGMIFADWLEGYEYWGFGDTDVIYGRLFEYLQTINYAAYDKINWMGHLCFIRNQRKYNEAALISVPGTIEAEDVFRNPNNLGFDERDFNRKCIASGMKIHDGNWAADIDIFYWRMRCVDLKTIHILLNTKEITYAPQNYSKQVFVVLDGTVYRIFLKNRAVRFEEFAYIHFRKEVPIYLEDMHTSSFIISRMGFFPLNYTREQLENMKTAHALINEYNNQENTLQEVHSFLHYVLRKYKKK